MKTQEVDIRIIVTNGASRKSVTSSSYRECSSGIGERSVRMQREASACELENLGEREERRRRRWIKD